MPTDPLCYPKKIMSLSLALMIAFGPCVSSSVAESAKKSDSDTVSPIKHVIVIVGENRSFDHLFATYVPIVRRDG